jgi:hypothetical protein
MTTDGGSRRPDAGRVYNGLLGGKDNYAEERQAASQLLAVVPDAQAAARANRLFLARATRFLARDSRRPRCHSANNAVLLEFRMVMSNRGAWCGGAAWGKHLTRSAPERRRQLSRRCNAGPPHRLQCA